jgi:hypothetical protein
VHEGCPTNSFTAHMNTLPINMILCARLQRTSEEVATCRRICSGAETRLVCAAAVCSRVLMQ